MPDDVTVIVLAAGGGTRMKSKTVKVLHPIAGRSMIGHVLHAARQLEPTRIVAVVGHQREQVGPHIEEIEPDVVHETETTLAFRDINPQAPTHVLVVPKAHHVNAAALATDDPALMGDVVRAAGAVAEQEGLGEGYRLVFNTGPQSGQTVFHVHCHVLGGRPMTWPPG